MKQDYPACRVLEFGHDRRVTGLPNLTDDANEDIPGGRVPGAQLGFYFGVSKFTNESHFMHRDYAKTKIYLKRAMHCKNGVAFWRPPIISKITVFWLVSMGEPLLVVPLI